MVRCRTTGQACTWALAMCLASLTSTLSMPEPRDTNLGLLLEIVLSLLGVRLSDSRILLFARLLEHTLAFCQLLLRRRRLVPLQKTTARRKRSIPAVGGNVQYSIDSNQPQGYRCITTACSVLDTLYQLVENRHEATTFGQNRTCVPSCVRRDRNATDCRYLSICGKKLP